MIEISGLTKTFGNVCAVDNLSFNVRSGCVTGFLGPNGAGKTTTLRCLLGLVTPTSGSATIDGLAYDRLDEPLKRVGAALEATNFHPGRTGRDHLRTLCLAGGLAQGRADETLDLVGMTGAARQRVWGYSLGMRQRLQLAAVLLGDPDVLVLDEPANGLDPEGIAWLRGLLRHQADAGRTVLVSSHVLSEVEQTVDEVVIIARGRLVRSGALADLVSTGRPVLVRSPDAPRLAAALTTRPDITVKFNSADSFVVNGATAGSVGHIALNERIELHELRDAPTDLEQVYFSLIDNESAPDTGNVQ